MRAEALAAAKAALDRRLDRTSPAPLAVAVSGGGDSMALLHLAADWAGEAARTVCVLTVDHALHRNSQAWAETVRVAAGRLGLPCTVLRWEGDKPTAGLAAAARAARHALLAEAARKAGVRVLLMGHTADDLAEAEIMRAGGSSVPDPREWAPSPAWPEGRGLFVLRPLLGVGRGDLRAMLRERGETWIEDPANSDPRSTRARARAHARAQAQGASPPAPSAPRPPPPARGEGSKWGGLTFSPSEIGDGGLLSAAVVCASGGSQPPRSAKLAKLAARLEDRSTLTATLSGARIVSSDSLVLLGRDPGRSGLPSAPARPGERLIWDGRFEIAADEDGTVRPLAGRAARLSKAERASVAAVPVWARPALPVLETAAGAVRLLAEARPLALERLRAACGVYAAEAELPPF